jgi:uncharacterized membrane protein
MHDRVPEIMKPSSSSVGGAAGGGAGGSLGGDPAKVRA